MPDILIVGAGPVGLTLAAELARYGISVRIVDKSARRSDTSKALVVWSRTLELLDHAGCADAFIAAGHKVDATNMVAGDTPLGRVEIGTVDSPYPYALMLPQSDTERLLEEHLSGLGVTVERRTELTAFTAGDTEVTATLRHLDDGTDETLHPTWLIGCDGAHSTIRHTLSLPFDGDTLDSDWILADIHLSGYPFPDTEMTVYMHEDGVLVLFPITPGRFRVVADLGPAPGAHKGEHPAEPTLDEVQTLVSRRATPGITLSDPVWLSGFRINERKVANYRAGRVFVAGDAAHVHSPAGGQGMNTGMQDAINLAWKLAMAAHGAAAPALLDSYSAERSPIGAQVLKETGRLTAMGTMTNPLAQSLRDVVGKLALRLPPVRHAIAETMTEITIGYPDSPLNGPSARFLHGPAPGARMPPAPSHVPSGSPRFTLFAAPSDATARLLAAWPNLLEPTLQPPPRPNGLWLVRPDGYVACTTRPDDAGQIDDYIRTLAPA